MENHIALYKGKIETLLQSMGHPVDFYRRCEINQDDFLESRNQIISPKLKR